MTKRLPSVKVGPPHLQGEHGLGMRLEWIREGSLTAADELSVIDDIFWSWSPLRDEQIVLGTSVWTPPLEATSGIDTYGRLLMRTFLGKLPFHGETVERIIHEARSDLEVGIRNGPGWNLYESWLASADEATPSQLRLAQEWCESEAWSERTLSTYVILQHQSNFVHTDQIPARWCTGDSGQAYLKEMANASGVDPETWRGLGANWGGNVRDLIEACKLVST